MRGQVLHSPQRRVADLGPAVEEALAVSRDGVPGPTFVECPVDLLYDEKLTAVAKATRWRTSA